MEMKKMSNETNLQVTFSKGRSGLFKKASELCILCGADVALIVFSPGEKVFSFGHPNVDVVIDRYLAPGPLPNSSTMHFIEAHRIANVRGEDLAHLKKAIRAQLWWASPIEEMTRAQLEQYKVALEELKKRVACLVDRAMLQSIPNPTHQLFLFPGASSFPNPNLVHQPPMLHNYTNRHHRFNNMGFPGYGYGSTAAFF
uniref:Agamous-like MADS-box protein AGL62 n=2 Tax=Cajanus cajan TaxID=3821 RepID=A0A151U7G7_CAJCA|nr:Agamous-like MADS-box protein AGL62 [Cajanus cajan]